MAFVNASLLIGGLLATIPVVLHLVLRQQPKRVVFPALQFLKERRDSNRRELNLRHWLLLFLRCSVVAVVAATLARPSVVSTVLGNWLVAGVLCAASMVVAVLAIVSKLRQKSASMVLSFVVLAAALSLGAGTTAISTLFPGKSVLAGAQQAPIAACLVVDSSARMEYRFFNQTRLEQAKETSQWLLRQFPPESTVAVLDSRPVPPFFSVDLAAAHGTLDRLRSTGVSDALPNVIAKAIDLVATSDKSRREVYVFSDLTEAAWPEDATRSLQTRLAEHPNVMLYVIDVGTDETRNVSLGELQLSAQSIVKGGELMLQTEVRSQAMSGEATVELLVEKLDTTRPILVDGRPLLPELEVRDRRTVTLTPDGSQRVEFRLRNWELGTQQGFVRVTAEDGLDSDNVRYFAVEVRESWPVVLFAPPDVNSVLMVEALAPQEQRQSGTARFACQTIGQGDLANFNLANHSIVGLLDPQPLPPAQWEQLEQFVESGRSLVIFLGHNAEPTASFNESAAQRLLGGKITRQWRATDRELVLAPHRFDHPVYALLRDQASSVPWNESAVFRHWVVDDLANGTSVIMPYSNGKPALLEFRVGQGRVVVATTPFHEESRPKGRPAWNELLTSENAWPNFVLLNELMRYLASDGDRRLNYRTGETANLVNDPSHDPARYQLFTPAEEPQDIEARDGRLVVAFTERPGAYRFKGNRGSPVVRGFAVNFAADNNLNRIPREQLDQGLGADRFRFARNREEIVFEVGEARAGSEFYPYLLVVIAVFLGLEHVLANRFYRSAG